jgi:hypothetical protein
VLQKVQLLNRRRARDHALVLDHDAEARGQLIVGLSAGLAEDFDGDNRTASVRLLSQPDWDSVYPADSYEAVPVPALCARCAERSTRRAWRLSMPRMQ